MNLPLIASLAITGLLSGWPQQALISQYTAPASTPLDPPVAADLPVAAISSESPELAMPPGQSGSSRLTAPPVLLVGVITAILLGGLAARVHPGLVQAAACWLAVCAVPLAFVDAAVRRLPDGPTAPAYAGTVALLLAAAAVGGHWPVLLRAILGGLALAGFYLVLWLISPSSMGLGDVKLAASLGTALAWFGWRALIAGGLAGFLLAGLYGIALLVSGRATPKQQIPFGPFMIAGTFLVILVGIAGS